METDRVVSANKRGQRVILSVSRFPSTYEQLAKATVAALPINNPAGRDREEPTGEASASAGIAVECFHYIEHRLTQDVLCHRVRADPQPDVTVDTRRIALVQQTERLPILASRHNQHLVRQSVQGATIRGCIAWDLLTHTNPLTLHSREARRCYICATLPRLAWLSRSQAWPPARSRAACTSNTNNYERRILPHVDGVLTPSLPSLLHSCSFDPRLHLAQGVARYELVALRPTNADSCP